MKLHGAYDKLMVEALLLIFVTPEEMAANKVDDTVRNFIMEFLTVRTNGTQERIEEMDNYIREICDEKK